MKPLFTEDDVLRYLYHEIEDQVERVVVGEAILRTPNLRTFYKQAFEIKRMLDDYNQNPHPTSVSLIMEYSMSKTGFATKYN
jgi:hypothetical protein